MPLHLLNGIQRETLNNPIYVFISTMTTAATATIITTAKKTNNRKQLKMNSNRMAQTIKWHALKERGRRTEQYCTRIALTVWW